MDVRTSNHQTDQTTQRTSYGAYGISASVYLYPDQEAPGEALSETLVISGGGVQDERVESQVGNRGIHRTIHRVFPGMLSSLKAQKYRLDRSKLLQVTGINLPV